MSVHVDEAEQGARSAVGGDAEGPLRERVLEVARGARDGVQVLRDRGDSVTVRASLPLGQSIIMKFWDRSGASFLVRRLTMTSPAWREWRIAERLWRGGVAVPRPIGRYTLGSAGGRFSEALVIADLGAVRTALDSLKDAISSGLEGDAGAIEAGVVALTVGVLRAGVVDPDHSMYNIVRDTRGELSRLDFELARECREPERRPDLYAAMLGRIVGSFVFSVQPDTVRAARFASALADRLGPSTEVRRGARERVEAMLEHQRAKKGIETRVPLDW